MFLIPLLSCAWLFIKVRIHRVVESNNVGRAFACFFSTTRNRRQESGQLYMCDSHHVHPIGCHVPTWSGYNRRTSTNIVFNHLWAIQTYYRLPLELCVLFVLLRVCSPKGTRMCCLLSIYGTKAQAHYIWNVHGRIAAFGSSALWFLACRKCINAIFHEGNINIRRVVAWWSYHGYSPCSHYSCSLDGRHMQRFDRERAREREWGESDAADLCPQCTIAHTPALSISGTVTWSADVLRLHFINGSNDHFNCSVIGRFNSKRHQILIAASASQSYGPTHQQQMRYNEEIWWMPDKQTKEHFWRKKQKTIDSNDMSIDLMVHINISGEKCINMHKFLL